MLRLAQIILPKADNDGADLKAVHYSLRRAIAKRFGGFTALDSFGGWIDDSGKLFEEPGVTYQIACEDSEETRAALREIATVHGRAAAQLAVFVSYPDGSADILDISHYLGAAGAVGAGAA